MVTPTLRTDRLILRSPEASDFPVYNAFYADAEASADYGGPLDPALAWRKLAVDIGHWHLRGFGMWSVVVRDTGLMVGGCGIVWPEGWPRPELTWWIVPAARRQGYALEASRAAIGWAYDNLEWDQVETHMNDTNAPARLLAEKLGGAIIARETFPDGRDRNIYVLPRPVQLDPAVEALPRRRRSLAHTALIVRDYDEAISWFTGVLGFTLVADEYQPEQDKRWVLVAPPGAGEDAAAILLARASSPEQEKFIGNQAGGRVFLFLKTDDFNRDYEAYRARGVRFVRPPAVQPYGKVAVFEDLYGNLWDLVQFADGLAPPPE